MICGEDVYVLEYNCRLGDPETQALLPLLDADLFDICLACCSGTLDARLVQWKRNVVSCTVVCASKGYPDAYPVGVPITGSEADRTGVSAFDSSAGSQGVTVLHAGTNIDAAGQLVTSGGRVLAVTAVAQSLHAAREAAYARIARVSFEGMHFRRDIGHRALDAPITLGVLGSTRGSALQAAIDAIEAGTLRARIAVVVSNRQDAPILDRAKKHGIPNVFISSKGNSLACS
jgi:phosphoribosylamine-glycine ligase